MLYAIMAEDAPDSGTRRAKAKSAHQQRLRELAEDGRVVLAGPFPAIDSPDPGPAGVCGSLIVAEFGSLAEARDWIDADPYVQAGVYARVEVKPFTQVLP